MSARVKPPTYPMSSSMYRGDSPTSTRRSNRSGSRTAASTPIIALTEWPDENATAHVESAADLEHVFRVPVERA